MTAAHLSVVENEGEIFADELPPGAELLHGQYRITRFLSAGGFGITYLAKNSLDRNIVIKECFPAAFCRRVKSEVQARSRSHHDELTSIVRLFVEEARSLAKLVHPNIVGVHQVFEENNTAYMSLDFIEGRDLLEMVEDKGWQADPAEMTVILRKLLDAIKFVHAEGMLHRDISPDNVLIQPDGEPILIDFGAAREQASKQSRVLSALRVVKDGYSPQEFYISGAEQGPPSDLYALGATLYHVITRELPPDSQTRLGAVAAQGDDPYVSLVGRVKGYNRAVLTSIDKALALMPKDRLQSAEEWLDVLDRKRGRVSRAMTRSLSHAPKPTPSAASPAAKTKKSGLGVLMGSAAVVAVVGGLAATQFDLFGAQPPETAQVEAPAVAASTAIGVAPTAILPQDDAPSNAVPGASEAVPPTAVVLAPEALTPPATQDAAVAQSPAQPPEVPAAPAPADPVARADVAPAPSGAPAQVDAGTPLEDVRPRPRPERAALEGAGDPFADLPVERAARTETQPVAPNAARASIQPAQNGEVADPSEAPALAAALAEPSLPSTGAVAAALRTETSSVFASRAEDTEALASQRAESAVDAAQGAHAATIAAGDASLAARVEAQNTLDAARAAQLDALELARIAAIRPAPRPAPSPDAGAGARAETLASLAPAVAAAVPSPADVVVGEEVVLVDPVPEPVAEPDPAPAAPATAASDAAAPNAAGSQAIAAVQSLWSVELPFALDSGVPVTSVNGIQISALSEIEPILRKAVVLNGKTELPVAFGVRDPVTGLEQEQVIVLPVVQTTALLNGMTFETRFDGEAWATVLVSLPPDSTLDLKPGDQLVAHLDSDRMIDGQTTLADILREEGARGTTSYSFAVQRDGQMWVSGFNYDMAIFEN
ncbi:MAG: protein kinase [Pseudomonadota bacterium]